MLSGILAVALLAAVVVLASRSNLLKDRSTAVHPPFSFSRVQLLWWVLVIAFCFLDHFGHSLVTGNFDHLLPALNETCLALLGVGVGTTGVAQIMDGRQRRAADLQAV